MLGSKKLKHITTFLLIISITLVLQRVTYVVGQGEPLPEIHEKLLDISLEERAVLEKLFALTQDIEEMEGEEISITQEIERITLEANKLEEMIMDEELNFERKREDLRVVLKSYQRRGPGTYLEIILNSSSLSEFLRRLNTLRDLTRNTGGILDDLDESKTIMESQRDKLTINLALLEEKQQDLREALRLKSLLKEELEEQLIALEDERELYQDYLDSIMLMWEQLKPIFMEVTGEFSRMIEGGNLPPEALETTILFLRIRGTINEEAFNSIITDNQKLPELRFSFKPGELEISLPSHKLALRGNFIILNGHLLRFQVNKGSFYGLPLDSSSIDELFKGGYLEINLKPLLDKNRISTIEVMDGYIEMIIIPSLF